jgi:hypothetical protein
VPESNEFIKRMGSLLYKKEYVGPSDDSVAKYLYYLVIEKQLLSVEIGIYINKTCPNIYYDIDALAVGYVNKKPEDFWIMNSPCLNVKTADVIEDNIKNKSATLFKLPPGIMKDNLTTQFYNLSQEG